MFLWSVSGGFLDLANFNGPFMRTETTYDIIQLFLYHCYLIIIMAFPIKLICRFSELTESKKKDASYTDIV